MSTSGERPSNQVPSGIPRAGWRQVVGLLTCSCRLGVVVGDSMAPTLDDGDHVVVRLRARPVPGDVVYVRDPRSDLLLVKRLASTTDDGQLWLVGDNPPASTDSRSFGAVDSAAAIGVVVARWPPWGQAETR